jgi:threonine/homoserine/homoserine lactone efflux protein
MPNFAAFLSYVLVTTFTPGPNNIMSMSNASRYGFKKSIFFNIGILVGFFIIISLCSIFSVSLYNLIPSIKPIMTYIGAIYILWLAWKTYKSAPHSESKSEKQTNTFMSGLLLQFVNPKVILYGITTVSTFIVPYYKSAFVLTGFSAILAFIGFVSTCCWALFGSMFQRFLIKNDKLVNTIMALLLVYCAVSLFL